MTNPATRNRYAAGPLVIAPYLVKELPAGKSIKTKTPLAPARPNVPNPCRLRPCAAWPRLVIGYALDDRSGSTQRFCSGHDLLVIFPGFFSHISGDCSTPCACERRWSARTGIGTNADAGWLGGSPARRTHCGRERPPKPEGILAR